MTALKNVRAQFYFNGLQLNPANNFVLVMFINIISVHIGIWAFLGADIVLWIINNLIASNCIIIYIYKMHHGYRITIIIV